jgi:hypothetical protein
MGCFKEMDNVKRSLSRDRRKTAKHTVKSGQGDRGTALVADAFNAVTVAHLANQRRLLLWIMRGRKHSNLSLMRQRERRGDEARTTPWPAPVRELQMES